MPAAAHELLGQWMPLLSARSADALALLAEAFLGCAPGHTRPFTSWHAIPQQNAGQGLRIDARTAATRWGGERMDYGIAIDSLLHRTRQAKEQRESG